MVLDLRVAGFQVTEPFMKTPFRGFWYFTHYFSLDKNKYNFARVTGEASRQGPRKAGLDFQIFFKSTSYGPQRVLWCPLPQCPSLLEYIVLLFQPLFFSFGYNLSARTAAPCLVSV